MNKKGMIYMSIINIITVALLVEAIWETLKMVWQKGKVNINAIGSLIVGIFIAVVAKVDLFNLQGIIITIPYVPYILTGILISRGSNFIHELYNNISSKI